MEEKLKMLQGEIRYQHDEAQRGYQKCLDEGLTADYHVGIGRAMALKGILDFMEERCGVFESRMNK